MDIIFTVDTIVWAVVKLLVLMSVGYVLYSTKVITEDFIAGLSRIVVLLVIPCLIASRIINTFDFNGYPNWWYFPVLGILYCICGMGLGFVFDRIFLKSRSPKEFMCAAGVQNCGYLPMNLIYFSFAGALKDRLLIYTFLFMTGFNVLVWSILPQFLKKDENKEYRLAPFFTPPTIGIIFAMLWVLIFGKGSMPRVIMDPAVQIGNMGFPLGMIILGAYLCKYRAFKPAQKLPVVSGVILKLLVFPFLALFVIYFIPLSEDVRFFLFLQAVLPTAVSLVIIGTQVGADNAHFSSVIFYSHIVSIFTIPLWFGVYRMVF